MRSNKYEGRKWTCNRESAAATADPCGAPVINLSVCKRYKKIYSPIRTQRGDETIKINRARPVIETGSLAPEAKILPLEHQAMMM